MCACVCGGGEGGISRAGRDVRKAGRKQTSGGWGWGGGGGKLYAKQTDQCTMEGWGWGVSGIGRWVWRVE